MGAKRNVTNNQSLLLQYENIPPYSIGGVHASEVAIECTCKGLIPWTSSNEKQHHIKTLYCNDVEGTIISPTNLVTQQSLYYQGFTSITDCDSCSGELKLLHRDGVSHCSFPLVSSHDLWYHEYSYAPIKQPLPKKYRLNDACRSELWHGRLVNPGSDILATIHKHVISIDRPLKKNPFYKSPSCLPNKMVRRHIARTPKHKNSTRHCTTKLIYDQSSTTEFDTPVVGVAGQHFHMDFGFICGSGYRLKTDDNKTVTSIDGYNFYLIIVDRVIRYM